MKFQEVGKAIRMLATTAGSEKKERRLLKHQAIFVIQFLVICSEEHGSWLGNGYRVTPPGSRVVDLSLTCIPLGLV